MAEPTGDYGDGTIRLLDDLTQDRETRICARCLGLVDWAEYFANDFYCDNCAAHADDFPWRTTHGGISP